jgi:rhodanese-related sulfurtransferase
MGWKDVFVFAEAGNETGMPEPPVIGPPPAAAAKIDCNELATLLKRQAATVIDLSLSPNYRKGHIAGAWFAIRSRLKRALLKIPVQGELVLTSEDGVLAGLAVAEASSLTDHPVRCLDGGNAAWQAAGLPLSTEPHMADDAVDVWLKPYERAGDTKGAMSEYLSWEVDLVERIERDGTCHFSH